MVFPYPNLVYLFLLTWFEQSLGEKLEEVGMAIQKGINKPAQKAVIRQQNHMGEAFMRKSAVQAGKSAAVILRETETGHGKQAEKAEKQEQRKKQRNN